MSKKFQPWTVSDFIRHLTVVLNDHGDLPVYMASDEEGNRFCRTGKINKLQSVHLGTLGDIAYANGTACDEPEKEICILWPFD